MNILHWLLDLIYPPKCVFCGKLLAETETDLCRRCRRALPELDEPVQRGEFFARCHSVFDYEGVVAESIHRFKFSGMQHYAPAYGRLLAMLLLRRGEAFDVLTWVPVSRQRRKARGYDQALLLAQAVAQELQVSCVPTLEKVRNNAAQSSLQTAATRRGNVLNAYRPVNPEQLQGKTVLLIDDVITTGSTLSECSRVLKTAGAAQVICATLAATKKSDRKNSR